MFTLALTAGVTLIGRGVFEWGNLLDAVILIGISTIIGVVAAPRLIAGGSYQREENKYRECFHFFN